VNRLHDLLARQLEADELSPDVPPDPAAWRNLLARVAGAYGQADQERQRLAQERDGAVRELEALRRERESIESRVVERTAELAASEARFRSLALLGSDWFWELDTQFAFVSTSGDLPAAIGLAAEALIGMRPWDVPGFEPVACDWPSLQAQLDAHEPLRDVVVCRQLPDGRLGYASITGEPRFAADGTFTGYRGIGRDITRQKIAEEKVNRLAHYDPLTGLFNRTAFFQGLEHALALARRHNRSLAVLFVDLDGFKDVNDAFGHGTGDDVLRVMGRRLTQAIRGTDTVARVGGDEFMVLADLVDDEGRLREFGQRLLDTIAEPFVLDGQECRVSASIGIALFPKDGEEATTLFKKADVAMYRAKESGRNSVAFFSVDDTPSAQDRVVLGAGLRRALDAGQLLLLYQPKVSTHTGVLTGVEALVRWQHPERGLLPPHAFIPMAEDSGLIRAIGHWVMQSACAQAQQWRTETAVPIRVAVNLSARQFGDEHLAAEIARALAETGLPAELLELEITESMMMAHPDRAAATLLEVRAMGVQVSIDDFGTGYSSLARLKKFPIDGVKIDRSFIRDIVTSPDDAAITTAIIAMAHSLRLRVVAEGVESRAQVRFLRERGCDEIQGFYYSRPVPASKILAIAQRHSAPRLRAVERSA